MSTARNTTIRDQHRRAIARTKPPCGIYLLHGPGEDECRIDYGLPHTDPMSYTVDHIVPVAKGGPDELANKQAAHRRPCLQSRQVRQVGRRVRPPDVHHRTLLVRKKPRDACQRPGPWTTF